MYEFSTSHYDILEITEDASIEEIRRQFQKLLLRVGHFTQALPFDKSPEI